ncbi:MAG: hypothetical protein RL357_314 [Pseudomonadota bacterium]
MSTPHPPAASPGTATHTEPAAAATRVWVVLVAIMVPVWLSALDSAIANTALPSIGAQLGSTPAASVWIVNAYQLAVVASLLPLASMGDRWGARRVFLMGVVVFAAASLACALANSLLSLSIARAVQGLGAAGLMSTNLALVKSVYPPHRLGRGMGLNALVVGLGYTSGPTVASLILSVADWPWLFGINVPVCIWALWLGMKTLPSASKVVHQRLDPWLVLLTALAFGSAIWTLINWTQRVPLGVWGWGAALAVVSGALMFRRQRGLSAPMFPVDLLKHPPFALSVLTSVSSFTTQGLAFVSLPFFFEKVLHRDAIETGFLLSSWALAVATMAPIAGRLSDRVRPGALGAVGLAILSLGLLTLASLSPTDGARDIVWRMALCGVGFGLFQSPNLKAIMTSAPASRSGGASGMIAMARLSGQTTGAALVALCFGWYGAMGAEQALWLAVATSAFASMVSASRLRFDSHMTEASR